jgi:hypothetical protein
MAKETRHRLSGRSSSQKRIRELLQATTGDLFLKIAAITKLDGKQRHVTCSVVAVRYKSRFADYQYGIKPGGGSDQEYHVNN